MTLRRNFFANYVALAFNCVGTPWLRITPEVDGDSFFVDNCADDGSLATSGASHAFAKISLILLLAKFGGGDHNLASPSFLAVADSPIAVPPIVVLGAFSSVEHPPEDSYRLGQLDGSARLPFDQSLITFTCSCCIIPPSLIRRVLASAHAHSHLPSARHTCPRLVDEDAVYTTFSSANRDVVSVDARACAPECLRVDACVLRAQAKHVLHVNTTSPHECATCASWRSGKGPRWTTSTFHRENFPRIALGVTKQLRHGPSHSVYCYLFSLSLSLFFLIKKREKWAPVIRPWISFPSL